MKRISLLVLVVTLTGLHTSVATAANCFGLFGLFCKEKNPVELVDEYLTENEQTGDLAANIALAKKLITQNKGKYSNEQVIEVAQQLVAFERISDENICQDEFISIVSELSSSVRKHVQVLPFDSIFFYKRRLSQLVSGQAIRQAEECLPLFNRDWSAADHSALGQEEELRANMETLKRTLLREHSHFNSYPSGLLPHRLIQDTHLDLFTSNETRTLVRDAFVTIAGLEHPFEDRQAVEELYENLLFNNCRVLFGDPKVKLLDRALTIIHSADFRPKERWFGCTRLDESPLVEWTLNLSVCKRTLITNTRKLIDFIYSETK